MPTESVTSLYTQYPCIQHMHLATAVAVGLTHRGTVSTDKDKRVQRRHVWARRARMRQACRLDPRWAQVARERRIRPR